MAGQMLMKVPHLSSHHPCVWKNVQPQERLNILPGNGRPDADESSAYADSFFGSKRPRRHIRRSLFATDIRQIYL